MTWKPNLTASEILEMQFAGYMVRGRWIMPGGYYEYYLIRLGGLSGRDEIKTTLSPRACYTYFKRHLTPLAADLGKAPAKKRVSKSRSNPVIKGEQ